MVCYERLEVGQFFWEMAAGLARSGGMFRFVDGVRVKLGTELGAGLVKVSRWAFVDGTNTSRMIWAACHSLRIREGGGGTIHAYRPAAVGEEVDVVEMLLAVSKSRAKGRVETAQSFKISLNTSTI